MHLKTIRDGEIEATANRSSRFYERNKKWFVQTREGYELGPYADLRKAEKALKDYISFLETADSQSIANLFNQFKEKLQANQD